MRHILREIVLNTRIKQASCSKTPSRFSTPAVPKNSQLIQTRQPRFFGHLARTDSLLQITLALKVSVCRLPKGLEASLWTSVSGPSRGGGWKVFPGPASFGEEGPPSPKDTEKALGVFQMASVWPEICIKSIFSQGGAPDPAGSLRRSPKFLVGWWVDTGYPSPRFLPLGSFGSFGVSISAHTE